MKNVKRILSMILVSVMVLTMALPAFAAGEGKITITNDQAEGLTYQAYQIFKGDVEEGKLTNIEWGNGVNGTGLLAALKADTTLGAAFADCKDAADVAKAMEGFANDGDQMQAMANIVFDYLSAPAGTSQETASPYTISGLDTGYYFVIDGSGLSVKEGRDSKYAMVKVLDDKAKIAVKTEVPEQEKKVQENQGENYTATVEEREKYGEGFNDVADYNINDTVPFEILSTVPNFKGMKSYYYAFDDVMGREFTFNNDVQVFVGGVKLDPSKYNLYVPGSNTDKGIATFTVEIPNLLDVFTEDQIGQQIKITFSAVLNENAVIGRPGNRNNSRLRYGNNPNDQGKPTPWDEVVVFTYELDVDKFDGDDAQKKLMDAEFVFYREVNGEKEYVVVNKNGKVQSWTTDKKQASVLKTDASGKFIISGLDEGVYFLEETKAPTGYNLLKDPVKVKIIADTNNGHNGAQNALNGTMINIDDKGAAHTPNKPDGYETAPIENNQGVELPETGGMGTTLFYIVGALLMIGAGVVLVTRRRVR